MFIKSITGVLILLMFGVNPLKAQDADLQKEIADAIAAGNATRLATFFDAAIDLIVPDNEGNFSKKQATQIMKFFFDRNKPDRFVIEHQDTSGDGSGIFIGYYTTTTGKTFRTYIALKRSGDQELIRNLRFEDSK